MKSLDERGLPLDRVDVDAVGARVELGSVEPQKPDESVGDGVFSSGAFVVLEVGDHEEADGVGTQSAWFSRAYLCRRC
jgi:hypothetical protein